MKKYILILLSIVLFACEHDNTVTYLQFTRDDLSHLYYDKDTLTFTGQNIVYKDTLTYLLNDTDTIYAPIKTEIHVLVNPFDFSNIKYITGNSLAYFSKETGFRSSYIQIHRRDNTWNTERLFQVGADNGFNAFEKQYLPDDTVSLDTALVLGKIYQNVYKFYPPVEGKTDIRLIYFAKKYGYIKIEKTDGSKLERIDKGK
jgi:hypothetical protein